MYMNQLTIIGFTGQDAELHYTQNGTPVTTLSVATKESWKNDQGEWQSRTEWHRVVAFGKLAEYANSPCLKSKTPLPENVLTLGLVYGDGHAEEQGAARAVVVRN
jgi:hypothetical protein